MKDPIGVTSCEAWVPGGNKNLGGKGWELSFLRGLLLPPSLITQQVVWECVCYVYSPNYRMIPAEVTQALSLGTGLET